jgi:hypothetical protein
VLEHWRPLEVAALEMLSEKDLMSLIENIMAVGLIFQNNTGAPKKSIPAILSALSAAKERCLPLLTRKERMVIGYAEDSLE